jgi:hypothetical protein
MSTTGETMPRKTSGALKKFSPGKLAKLRGDMAYHIVATEIGQRTGVMLHPDTLRRYEDGRSEPVSENLAAIAAYFGVAIDDLFE